MNKICTCDKNLSKSQSASRQPQESNTFQGFFIAVILYVIVYLISKAVPPEMRLRAHVDMAAITLGVIALHFGMVLYIALHFGMVIVAGGFITSISAVLAGFSLIYLRFVIYPRMWHRSSKYLFENAFF